MPFLLGPANNNPNKRNPLGFVRGALSTVGRVIGGGGNGGNYGGGSPFLRTGQNPGAQLARQQIIQYTGIDVLGKAASLRLTVGDVANLEDVKRYMSEQRELLKYSVQKLEKITDDVVEIERMMSEIIGAQLKSRQEVDKYLKNALLAGDRYQAHSNKIAQQYTNEQQVLAADTAGEMALDNIQTKLKLLRSKEKFNLQKQNAQQSHREQVQAQSAEQKVKAQQAQEAQQKRQLINNGTGQQPRGDGWTRFKSYF